MVPISLRGHELCPESVHESLYAQIEIVVNFFRIFENFRVQKLGFPARDPGSGRYREVREAHRNRFHLFSSRLTRGARSYDQKTKKVNDY